MAPRQPSRLLLGPRAWVTCLLSLAAVGGGAGERPPFAGSLASVQASVGRHATESDNGAGIERRQPKLPPDHNADPDENKGNEEDNENNENKEDAPSQKKKVSEHGHKKAARKKEATTPDEEELEDAAQAEETTDGVSEGDVAEAAEGKGEEDEKAKPLPPVQKECLPAIWGVYFSIIISIGFAIGAGSALLFGVGTDEGINVVSWNIGGTSNNPFEFYMPHPDPNYEELMQAVERLIAQPSGASDVCVADVLKDEWVAELCESMAKEQRFGPMGEVQKMWKSQYSRRKIVTEFLSDKKFGQKMLIAVPDRITNTISTVDKGKAYRPTVINAFEEKLDRLAFWFPKWHDFMFKTGFHFGPKGSEADIASLRKETMERPVDLLAPMKAGKYKHLTLDEERLSLPLQVLCLAAFDAIMVHLINAAASGKWFNVKQSLADLNKTKTQKCLEILSKQYDDAHAMLLQEVDTNFVQAAKEKLGNLYHVLSPTNFDEKADSNCIILLRKTTFEVDAKEVHQLIEEHWDAAMETLAPGDLFAVLAKSKQTKVTNGEQFLFGTFLGDGEGLTCLPMMKALQVAKKEKDLRIRMCFGMTTNAVPDTKALGEGGIVEKQGISDFNKRIQQLGLSNCFETPQHTVFKARTYLQAQLNKAVPYSEIHTNTKTDRAPKDTIVYDEQKQGCLWVNRDNTALERFYDGIFPTPAFPSDHAIVCAKFADYQEYGK